MIRSFEPADADEVIRVWLAATIPGQSFLPEQHWRDMEPEIRALMPLAAMWIVEDAGDIVAFMAVIDGTIGGLFTHPDHQGRGFGRSLIDLACDRFSPLYIEVFEANTTALAFYRRCGFVDHAERTDPASGLNQLILRMERPPAGGPLRDD